VKWGVIIKKEMIGDFWEETKVFTTRDTRGIIRGNREFSSFPQQL